MWLKNEGEISSEEVVKWGWIGSGQTCLSTYPNRCRGVLEYTGYRSQRADGSHRQAKTPLRTLVRGPAAHCKSLKTDLAEEMAGKKLINRWGDNFCCQLTFIPKMTIRLRDIQTIFALSFKISLSALRQQWTRLLRVW